MNNNQDFVNGTYSTDNFICDRDKALNEIQNLKKIVDDLRGYIASDLENDLAAFHDIKGFNGGNKYKEDNLFYDIKVEGLSEASGNGENYDDFFVGCPDAFANTLEGIIDKINNHIDAYDYYSKRKDFPDFVRQMMERLKGSSSSLLLSLDDLTTMSREEIMEKYGVTAEDLAKNPETMEFASKEEKNKYYEMLEYFNEEFNEEQRHYSQGIAQDMASKLYLATTEVSSQSPNASQTTISGESEDILNYSGQTISKTNGQRSSIYQSNSSENGSTSGESSYSTNSTQTQGSISYRQQSVPEIKSVEASINSNTDSELQTSTNKSNAVEELEQKLKAKEEKDAINNSSLNANSNPSGNSNSNSSNSFTKQNVKDDFTNSNSDNSSNNINNNNSSSTLNNVTNTTSESTNTTDTNNYNSPSSKSDGYINVASVDTPKTNSTVVATPDPEVKDVVSNVKNGIKDITSNATTGADSSRLVSSVTSNQSPMKPIKIDTPTTTESETSTAGRFVPPIAGIATAGVAGIGTKLYIDKKEDNDKKEEQDNKFFDYNLIKNENIQQPASREELVENLDDN